MSISPKMFNKFLFQLIYMLIGVVIGIALFSYLLNSTNNPYLAMGGMAIVLAFWIGTLAVAFTVKSHSVDGTVKKKRSLVLTSAYLAILL